MKNDLKEFFPYKVIEVYGAEGDDVIATLCKNLPPTEPILIVGSDKDYAQLHKFPNVRQYSSKKKSYIKIDNPIEELNTLVITGDEGDGIPNIKSSSDSFVAGKRQSSIMKSNLEKWKKLEPQHFCENRTMLENYKRNKELIDFDFIPADLQDNIMKEYQNLPKGNKTMVMNYFIANKMRNLMEDLNQF